MDVRHALSISWPVLRSFVKQLLLDIAPPPLPTLANFVPGCNVELLQTLESILVGAEKERFFYLWGSGGCGKSHLLQGLARAYEHEQMKATYFACDEHTRFATPGEADCVLVDDAHRLGAEAQIGLFNLYNHIRDEWQDSRLHELAVPGIELASRMAR